MRKLLKKFRYRAKVITLIELLVVIVILGVLVAVAVPNVNKCIGSGQDEAFNGEWNNVGIAAVVRG